MRILVIDDDEDCRLLTKRRLALDGDLVEVVESGEAALDKLKEGSFDLVITDRTMPGMSGDELAKAVKKKFPNVPVIMLTGSAEEMVFNADHPGGVDELVSKPAMLTELRQVINRICAR